jgi:hypothetical protein
MIQLQQFAQHAAAYEMAQATALLAATPASLLKIILLAPAAGLAIMVLGTVARLRA